MHVMLNNDTLTEINMMVYGKDEHDLPSSQKEVKIVKANRILLSNFLDSLAAHFFFSYALS